jgi:hypothetical protein
MLASANGQISWDKQNPCLEFHGADNKSQFTIEFMNNNQEDFWESTINAFNHMMDFIEDYEFGTLDVDDEKNNLFIIELKACNKRDSDTTLIISYNPKQRIFSIDLDSALGSSGVDVDFNNQDTWDTWVEILKQMKRDYISHTRSSGTRRIYVDLSPADNDAVSTSTSTSTSTSSGSDSNEDEDDST